MISIDFAPNEKFSDSLTAFKILFNISAWKKQNNLEKIQVFFADQFHINPHSVFLFLTGRSAIFSVLQCLNIQKGSDVLVQAFTCEAVILPILENGLNPIYIDISDKNYSLHYEDLAKKYTTNSKVLILQHTFGIISDRDKIIAFAQKNNLIVIEDLAHGFPLGFFKKDNLSTIKILSFGRSKAYSSVFGGAAIIPEKYQNSMIKIWEKLSEASNVFIFKLFLYKLFTPFIKSTYEIFIGRFIHKIFLYTKLFIPEITEKEKSGYFDYLLHKKYSNILAATLIDQLDKISVVQLNRKKISSIYNKAFLSQNISDISVFPLIRFPLLVKNRNSVMNALIKDNIILGKWYDQVITPKSIHLEAMKYKEGSCPVAEKIANHIINLPTLISEKEAKKIINFIKMNDI